MSASNFRFLKFIFPAASTLLSLTALAGQIESHSVGAFRFTIEGPAKGTAARKKDSNQCRAQLTATKALLLNRMPELDNGREIRKQAWDIGTLLNPTGAQGASVAKE